MADVLLLRERSQLKSINWTPEWDVAFRKLKKSIAEAPVLALPRFGENFLL